MRSDMAQVIVERPRRGHRLGYPRGFLARFARDLESAPSRESMGRGYGQKGLNENLAPLVRFLRSRVGRPWSAVFSEISERISVSSAVQKHVVDHLRDFVSVRTWEADGAIWTLEGWSGVQRVEARGRHAQFYVCPRTGLLLEAPRRRPQPPKPDPDRRILDRSTELRRLAGVWYLVQLADTNPGGSWDALERAWVTAPRHAKHKRQLGKRELEAFGLR